MEMGVCAEALDPAEDRRAGQAALAQERDDRLVERLAVAVVRFADVDPDEQGRPVDARHQSARPSVSPAETATSPRTTDPPRFARARRPRAALDAGVHDSSMYVENVV